jgi:hypothetical protein
MMIVAASAALGGSGSGSIRDWNGSAVDGGKRFSSSATTTT